jgi:hypothetical protein
MKKIVSFCLLSFPVAGTCFSQLTTAPDGGNKKAMVGERIGITDVTVHYDRPGIKGREGKTWGQLVHVGYTDLGFGTSNKLRGVPVPMKILRWNFLQMY